MPNALRETCMQLGGSGQFRANAVQIAPMLESASLMQSKRCLVIDWILHTVVERAVSGVAPSQSSRAVGWQPCGAFVRGSMF